MRYVPYEDERKPYRAPEMAGSHPWLRSQRRMTSLSNPTPCHAIPC